MFSSGRFGLTVLVVLSVSLIWTGYLAAHSSGQFGVCDASDGCRCHSQTPNANGDVTVSISGPQVVDAGSTNSYTISVAGIPAGTTGGFNLCASGGTLIAGTGMQLDTGELTHSNPDNRSWTFEWTAPSSGAANYEFLAVAQATNGGQTSGDSWNWYGDAQGTPFSITVVGPLPTVPTTWGLLKAQYR